MANRLTVGSASFHCTPEESRRTLPIQQWGTLCQCSQYPLHSQGEGEDKEESHNQMGGSSPRWAGSLRKRGHTRIHLMGCCKLCSVNGDSARGTEHYRCQGHLTFNSDRGTEHLKVPWAHWTLVATRASVWIRSDESFYTFLPWSPLQIRVGASLSVCSKLIFSGTELVVG